MNRTYLIKRPKPEDGRKFPLVLSLHGGGGQSTSAIDDKDPKGILTIAPQGIDNTWNISGLPASRNANPQQDDIGFLNALIRYAVQQENADPNQVTILGPSRGGMMGFYALSELNAKIQKGIFAIATIPSNIRSNFQLTRPTHILIMNGTKDPLVPYEGGPGNLKKMQGNFSYLATEEVARDLAVMQGLAPEPTIRKLPDNDPNDNCLIEEWTWKGNDNQGSVTLIKSIGGGHTIPGTQQFLPKWIVGPTCQDLDGLDYIDRFIRK